MNDFILYTFAALGMIETLVLTVGGLVLIAAIWNSKEEWILQKSSSEIMNKQITGSWMLLEMISARCQ